MNIVLGITGGIAAYKTPELVRRLRERGADVQIVMTASAEEFVTPTSLQAVSGRPIRTNLWDKEAEAAMSHIELARWADLVLIAPATAEIMARLAGGGAPDLLTTLCLATEAPIAIAPAMNRVMWANPGVQANRDKLEARGTTILGPDEGSQACGETGAGRMLDPGDIAAAVCDPEFAGTVANGPLAGRTVLVTAGPTREPIDRRALYHQSQLGEDGLCDCGCRTCPGCECHTDQWTGRARGTAGRRGAKYRDSGRDVRRHSRANRRRRHLHRRRGCVGLPAADRQAQKIKKTKDTMSIDLIRSPDILASVAALDDPPFTVGFAAETENVREYALGKLENKKLDMIIANRVGSDCGFDYDDNAAEALCEWRREEL